MADGNGVTTYSYGTVGNNGALQLTAEDGPFAHDKLEDTYDALGRVQSRKIDGQVESFTYDLLGRVTSHNSPLGSFALSYLGQTNQLARRTLQSTNYWDTTWQYGDNLHDRQLDAIDYTCRTQQQLRAQLRLHHQSGAPHPGPDRVGSPAAPVPPGPTPTIRPIGSPTPSSTPGRRLHLRPGCRRQSADGPDCGEQHHQHLQQPQPDRPAQRPAVHLRRRRQPARRRSAQLRVGCRAAADRHRLPRHARGRHDIALRWPGPAQRDPGVAQQLQLHRDPLSVVRRAHLSGAQCQRCGDPPLLR